MPRWKRTTSWLVVAAASLVAGVAALALRSGDPRGEPPGPRDDLRDGGGAPRVPEAAQAEPSAGDGTCAALGGLGRGDAVGAFVVTSVSEPVRGAIVIRTREGPIFEVRLVSEDPAPPARARDVGVYYRTMRIGSSYPPEDLIAAAQAIAARIERAPAAAQMPSGLTALAREPGQPL